MPGHELPRIFRTGVREPFDPLLKRGCKGLQALCRGWRGVPATFFSLFSPPQAAKKRGKKAFFGDAPNPGRDAPLPAPSFFEWVFQKFGVTHVKRRRPCYATKIRNG